MGISKFRRACVRAYFLDAACLTEIFRLTECFTSNHKHERSTKLVSVKNQRASHDRNAFNLLDNLQFLHIVTIIVIISFILVLCVLIILTLTAAVAKIGTG